MPTNNHAILRVDDDESVSDNLKIFISRREPEWIIETATGPTAEEDALRKVKQRFEAREPFSLVITDLPLRLPYYKDVDDVKNIPGIHPLYRVEIENVNCNAPEVIKLTTAPSCTLSQTVLVLPTRL